jgi:hypothetical protein
MKHHNHRQTDTPDSEPSTLAIWAGAALALAAVYIVILLSVLF